MSTHEYYPDSNNDLAQMWATSGSMSGPCLSTIWPCLGHIWAASLEPDARPVLCGIGLAQVWPISDILHPYLAQTCQR